MIRRRQVLAIAAAAVLLTALSACSSGGNASPTPTRSERPPARASDRTFTKANLGIILDSVNANLALNGTVTTQDGPQIPALDALQSAIGGSAKFSPASCASLIESNAQLGTQGVVAGVLTSPQLNLVASTVAGTTLPPALMSGFASTETAILSTCKHLTITATVLGQSVSVAVDFTPLAVKTAAAQTVGFTETFTITGTGGGAGRSSHIVIEAVDGNLLLMASGVSVQDKAGLVSAINAAVSAGRA